MFFIKNGIDNYKKIFCYQGIAGRKTYFFFSLFQMLIAGIIILAYFLLIPIFNNNDAFSTGKIILLIAIIIVFFVVTICSWLAGLAISVRRLHDIGQSGWLLLAPGVISLALYAVGIDDRYLINFIFSLGLLLARSKTENNKYRPDEISHQ